MSYHRRTATEQAIEDAPHLPTPVGNFHLHLLASSGEYRWVVRHIETELCGSPRCRKVHIEEVKEAS